ncbi:hypothetical protein NHQ30_010400 [Ciborinia camelliae]|nr:hypothetical protein NHQ30_010400 [Ciborinia camelliae]
MAGSSRTHPDTTGMRPLFAVEIPSYQPEKSKNSTSSSTSSSMDKPRYHLRGRPNRAESKIKQLQNFGPDLEALERRTQGLLMDQASLNFNLSNRLQMPLPQTSPQHHHLVPGPLQHPYALLKQSGHFFSNQALKSDQEDVEMNDTPEDEDEDEGENEVPVSPSPFGQTPALHSPRESHCSTPNLTIENARHPILGTTTTCTAEQIELELSYLMVEKHNELRLIQTELAKAQIMLEQLRRVHLRPFFFYTNEKGEMYIKRVVVRKFSAEEKKRLKEENELEKLEREERKNGGSGMALRSKFIRR